MTRAGKASEGIDSLLVLLDTAYDRQSWHGTNLRGSLRGLSLEVASWRPRAGAHNVWELVVHAAYWRDAAWRRLTGAPRASFPLTGSNWFTRPAARASRAWREDLRLLEAMHQQLRSAVAAERAVGLHRRLPRSRVTRLGLIAGVAAHDVYHAGQIQLLKKLFARRSSRSAQ